MDKEVMYEYVECHVAVSEIDVDRSNITFLLQRFTIKLYRKLKKSEMSLRFLMENYKKYHSKNNIIILTESCAVSPWLSCFDLADPIFMMILMIECPGLKLVSQSKFKY